MQYSSPAVDVLQMAVDERHNAGRKARPCGKVREGNPKEVSATWHPVHSYQHQVT